MKWVPQLAEHYEALRHDVLNGAPCRMEHNLLRQRGMVVWAQLSASCARSHAAPVSSSLPTPTPYELTTLFVNILLPIAQEVS